MRKVDAARGKPREKMAKTKVVQDDEPSDEEVVEEEQEYFATAKDDKAIKHFYIVQQGKYFGIFNAKEATVSLFKTRVEAEEQLRNIFHGRDGYHLSYGGIGNRSRSRESVEVHY
jgi:hypothetical protein